MRSVAILGPLLFLLGTSHNANSSNLLVPIMFADNFFSFEHSNINTLFKTGNDKLIKDTLMKI